MHEAIICPLNFILASNPPSLRLSFCRACLKAAGINIQPVRTPQTVEPALELPYSTITPHSQFFKRGTQRGGLTILVWAPTEHRHLEQDC